jgi:hypothetical protein
MEKLLVNALRDTIKMEVKIAGDKLHIGECSVHLTFNNQKRPSGMIMIIKR